MEEKQFKNNKKSIADVLIIPMVDNFEYIAKIQNELRNQGKNVQIYYEDKKIKTKFKYADKLQIPYVVVVGEDEVKNNTYTIKNMQTGEQQEFPLGTGSFLRF